MELVLPYTSSTRQGVSKTKKKKKNLLTATPKNKLMSKSYKYKLANEQNKFQELVCDYIYAIGFLIFFNFFYCTLLYMPK